MEDSIKTNLASSVTHGPERGAVAISVNGVPFFGPEEGPGERCCNTAL